MTFQMARPVTQASTISILNCGLCSPQPLVVALLFGQHLSDKPSVPPFGAIPHDTPFLPYDSRQTSNTTCPGHTRVCMCCLATELIFLLQICPYWFFPSEFSTPPRRSCCQLPLYLHNSDRVFMKCFKPTIAKLEKSPQRRPTNGFHSESARTWSLQHQCGLIQPLYQLDTSNLTSFHLECSASLTSIMRF